MGKNDAGEEAKQARREEEARQAEIREGTTRINKTFNREFRPQFFKQQAESYKRFARPQLDRQFEDAGNELTYDLADRGLLDSSVRGEKTAELEELFETNRQDMIDRAREFSTTARNNVEDARSNLIMNLQATGDAEGAAKAALNRADALSRPPAYSPLTDLFTSFTAGLGTQAQLERAYAAGSPIKPRYNLGIYGPSQSVKVS